ncbi:diguanylate cyclase [Bacillus phage SP-15]|uniref:Diguanylate cyclase n=1 Tax=Bacillus phage SP-15 TaxID=1792032 RepID=A0A127AWB9_9CAUD|nr:diguanylate cyclase [Bacillus phage SP-15]AMM44948.1 diguanylate cyclase [Bacillus phage SP-15]
MTFIVTFSLLILIVVTLYLLSKNRKLNQMVSLDHLTNTYNRRYLNKYRKYKDQLLSVLVIDIDHFKSVNDTYGHPAGDQILSELAGLLKRIVREEDSVVRIGGEEFLVILKNTPIDIAESLAVQILHAIGNHRFTYNDKEIRITVSIGVSESYTDIDRAISEADLNLYHAKESGRNQIRVHCN